MDNDTSEIIGTIIGFLITAIGYILFKYLTYKIGLWYLHKKYNLGGFQNINPNAMTWKKASKILGVRTTKLRKMSKPEIKKVYRMKAKKAHPDHGGNNTKFNTLNEAYQFAYAA